MAKTDFKTSYAFHYLWIAWKIVGVYPVVGYNIWQTLHATLIIISLNIPLSFLFVMKLFFFNDFNELLDNVPMNVGILISSLKAFYAMRRRREILSISGLFDSMDLRLSDSRHRNRIKEVISICHKTFVGFMVCYQAIDTLSAILAALSHQRKLPFEMWVPFNYQESNTKYMCVFIYQYFGVSILALQNLASDIAPPSFLMVLTRHLNILMERIETLGRNENAERDLIECFNDHQKISRIFNVLQDTIAYTIFIQFVGTSLIIAMQILNFFLHPPNFAQMLLLALFTFGATLQILPCCYYSNQFMEASDNLVTAIYSSSWYDQSRTFKRNIIIFMQMTQKKNVIIAGKLVPVTLATFVSIMKMTYSLLTIMRNFQD